MNIKIYQGEALYITNPAGIVSRQPEWAVYHQAAGQYTLTRDENAFSEISADADVK